MARSPCSAAVTSPNRDHVAMIGACGALGFGLALRLGLAGVPIAIGSRDAARDADTAGRDAAIVPGGRSAASTTAARGSLPGLPLSLESMQCLDRAAGELDLRCSPWLRHLPKDRSRGEDCAA
jgi:NAD(P)-dependent dehydrogenase (short-subunit alcohol dehydrogenase family)